MVKNNYFIGCDVGTGSVRAGVFNQHGKMLSMQTQSIKMWRPKPDFVEQSSQDIWHACCSTIKNAAKEAEVEAGQIQGIGFDATCSLVVLGEDDKPLTVSPTGSGEQNIIVWMDHRSMQEAEEINNTQHEVLKYVGGTISPEMETPKLFIRKVIWENIMKLNTRFSIRCITIKHPISNLWMRKNYRDWMWLTNKKLNIK